MKNIKIILSLCVLVLSLAGSAHARDLGGLVIAPLRITLAPGQTTATVTLTNKGDRNRTFRVSLIDQMMDEHGTAVNAPEGFAYSVKNMVRFMPRRVVLGAGQRQNIRLMVRRPADLADGDYHSHLVFDEENETTTAANVPTDVDPKVLSQEKGFVLDLGTLYSMGVPIIVQQGKLESSLNMTSARFEAGRANDAVRIGLARTGNAEAMGMVEVKLNGENVVTPRRARVYRERDNIELPLTVLDSMRGKSGMAEAIFSQPDPNGSPTLVEVSRISFEIPAPENRVVAQETKAALTANLPGLAPAVSPSEMVGDISATEPVLTSPTVPE